VTNATEQAGSAADGFVDDCRVGASNAAGGTVMVRVMVPAPLLLQ
jgi:hypothetical protein